ncbi:MAG TPA: PQQ-binding-like beta-propeller repeat protein, partial [Actinotalea sp.]|nr:PQQ-binding-like beta-propeller repeat protein [Actinotalea sp.]
MVLRGARPGGDLVPVLLDDEPDDPHASAPRDRRLAPVALALLAGLLVADVAVQAADAGRDGRRFTEAVSLSGSLVDPLEVAWREPARSVLGVADSLVLIGQRTGGEHVVGVDAATGEVRWRAPLRIDPGWCTFAAQTPEPVLVLVCARGVQSTLVTVLEPEDGGTVASRIWPGTLAVLRAVDGDLVLAGSDGAGRMVAERWSPHDDQVAWQFGSERGVVTPTE